MITYNSPESDLCHRCDAEPAVYSGLCEICLTEQSENFGAKKKAPRKNRKKPDTYEED